MTYHRILLPFSGSDRLIGVLPTALAVCKRFDAHCEVLFVRPEPYQALPYLGDAAPGVVVKEIVESANKAADASGSHLAESLAKAIKEAGGELIEGDVATASFSAKLVQLAGDSLEITAERSRLSDLAILVGGEGHPEIVTSAGLSGVMLKTGRPVLIVPESSYGKTIGDRAVIAWDGSTEASNAVIGALPFLQAASSVLILNARQLDEDSPRRTTASLSEYLNLCGITHTDKTVEAGKDGIAHTLLNEVKAANADLLVMGGYGHSRVREFIVGGVTQHFLEHTTVPLLMAH